MSFQQSTMAVQSPAPDLTRQPVHRRILGIALPAIVANLTSVLPGIVDTALVGRSGTAIDLGGIALGVTITGFILWAFSFLRMGTAGFAAQAYGARDESEQRSTFLRALGLSIIFGFALILLMVPLSKLFFTLFNTGNASVDVAGRYYYYRMFAAPFDLVLYVIIGWLLGRQRVRDMLLLQVFLNLLNIGLCYALVAHLGWGVDGAAIATSISITASCLFGLDMVRRQFQRLAPRSAESRLIESEKAIGPDGRQSRHLPAHFGVDGVSRLSGAPGRRARRRHALRQPHPVRLCLPDLPGSRRLRQATDALVGQAVGGRDRMRLSRVVRAGSVWCLVFAAAASAALHQWGPALLPLFTHDVDILKIAETHFFWIAGVPLISIWCFQLDGIYFGATRGRRFATACCWRR